MGGSCLGIDIFPIAEWHVPSLGRVLLVDAFLHAAAVDAHYLCGRRCPAALLYLEEGGQAGMGVVLDPDHCRHRERFRLRGRFIGQDAGTRAHHQLD